MMKFEEKFLDANVNDQFEYQNVNIMKCVGLGVCTHCSSLTRWLNLDSQTNVCSEECFESIHQHKDALETFNGRIDRYAPAIHKEMSYMCEEDVSKDIIIVVRDQLELVRTCIESVREHTTNYKLFIWDNASGPETADYLQSLISDNIEVVRSDVNLGFIQPNNELVEWGTGEYIILLNSDCIVFEGWWKLMVGFLRHEPDVAEVGWVGGYLDENGIGSGKGWGYDIDYLAGWGVAFSRKTYEEFGLFNKQLRFAYGEDSDFSLRLKEAGKKIYALHFMLVNHVGNATVNQVKKEGLDVTQTFKANHEYIRTRWQHYLEHERIRLKATES
jgi:GT2 family glycosyltransferase